MAAAVGTHWTPQMTLHDRPSGSLPGEKSYTRHLLLSSFQVEDYIISLATPTFPICKHAHTNTHAHSLAMTPLVLLGVLAALAGLCSCQCPMSGCDGLRSFSSTPREAEKTTRSTITREEGPLPELLWSYESHTPSGAGCVTNGPGDVAVVICPMAAGQK